jgi:hypothetical protein
MREIKEMPGISIGGHIINNLLDAYDAVLISNTEENLQELMNIVNKQSTKKGLSLNLDKTETMIISKRMQHNGSKLRQVDTF